jgi:hypothetical protein
MVKRLTLPVLSGRAGATLVASHNGRTACIVQREDVADGGNPSDAITGIDRSM